MSWGRCHIFVQGIHTADYMYLVQEILLLIVQGVKSFARKKNHKLVICGGKGIWNSPSCIGEAWTLRCASTNYVTKKLTLCLVAGMTE